MNTLAWLIFVGGLAHFGILTASALVPRVLQWRRQLEKFDPLMRQVVWVHGLFIVLVILGFGTISVSLASELASGETVARAFCALVGLFWLARLVIQLSFFDAKSYLTTRWLKLGYHGLTVTFAYLASVFGSAAVL